MLAGDMDETLLALEIVRFCNNRKEVNVNDMTAIYTMITCGTDYYLNSLSSNIQINTRYKNLNLFNVFNTNGCFVLYLKNVWKGYNLIGYKEFKKMHTITNKFISVVLKSLNGDVPQQQWLSVEGEWI